jgi:hypothetical protein
MAASSRHLMPINKIMLRIPEHLGVIDTPEQCDDPYTLLEREMTTLLRDVRPDYKSRPAESMKRGRQKASHATHDK